MQDPFIVQNILPEEDLKNIQKYALNMWINNPNYDNAFGRHQWANTPELVDLHNKLTDLAREYFERPDIKPSWCLLSIYEGKEAKLWKHKDDNACTYHIDFCVFQKTAWDLWVENNDESKPYTLQENDGLFMYGNDQLHWREKFPNPETNLVCNAFFFFCEPDHWYFTEGPDYLNTHIRAEKGIM
jgi:hypothetical protein